MVPWLPGFVSYYLEIKIMVSSICSAADPAKCRYHGAARRMFVAEQQMLTLMSNNQPVPSDIVSEYLNARTAVEKLEREGWDEGDYREKVAVGDNQRPTSKATVASPQSQEHPTPVEMDVRVGDETVTFIRGDQYDTTVPPRFVRFHGAVDTPKEVLNQYVKLLNYSFKQACVRGKGEIPVPVFDSKSSFLVPVTGEFREDTQKALHDFARLLRQYSVEGTPPRASANNTRKYDAVEGKKRINFRVYFAS